MVCARIGKADRSRARWAFVLRRQAQMLPAALFQQMPAQILLMAALHDDHHGGGLGIVHPRGHHHIPPIERCLANRIRLDFLHVMRIVANDAVASFAGSRAAH